MGSRVNFDHRSGDFTVSYGKDSKDIVSDANEGCYKTVKLASLAIEVPYGEQSLILTPAQETDFDNYSFARDAETMQNVRNKAWSDKDCKKRLSKYQARWEDGNPYSGMLINLQDKDGNLEPIGHFVYGGADESDVAKILKKEPSEVTEEEVAKFGEVAAIIDKNHQKSGIMKALSPVLTGFYKEIVLGKEFREELGVKALIKDSLIATSSPKNPALGFYVEKMGAAKFVKDPGNNAEQRFVFSCDLGREPSKKHAANVDLEKTLGMLPKNLAKA